MFDFSTKTKCIVKGAAVQAFYHKTMQSRENRINNGFNLSEWPESLDPLSEATQLNFWELGVSNGRVKLKGSRFSAAGHYNSGASCIY